MKKAVLQFTACCLAVGMTFTGTGTVAFADNHTVLAGVGAAGSSASEGEEAEAQTDNSETEAAETESETAAESEDTQTEEAETDAAEADTAETETSDSSASDESGDSLDTSMSGNLAFAQCEEYINVRSEPSTDSEVVGKVYNNGSVTILGQIGDWYQIQSGNATGYVSTEYFATGDEAQQIADEVGYNVATVYSDALMVRSGPSEDSEAIGTVYSADQLEVVAYEGDWMKVVLDDGTYGYVNAYYVGYDTYYATAETLQEEQQRLDEQWLQYLADQEAERAAAEQVYQDAMSENGTSSDAAEPAYDDTTYDTEASYDDTTYDTEPVYDDTTYDTEASYDDTTYDTEPSYDDTTYETEPVYEDTTTYETEASYDDSAAYGDAQASADAAYQAYLDAQAAADAATQQADEQLVYDTYNAAVDAYQKYLSAQAAADNASAGQTTYETEASYDDTTYETEASYDDTTYETEASYDDTTYETEPSYDDTYETEASYDDMTYETEASYDDTTYETEGSYSSGGQSIVDFAVQFVGNPYVYGGTSLTNGADCSGFTQSVFANFGISIPRTAAEQASSGTEVSLSDIQPGDLLFYSDGSGIGHVSIYMGGGQVVHASTSSTGIIISSYSYRSPVSARRYW